VAPAAWAPRTQGKNTWVGFRNAAVTPAKGAVPPATVDMGGVVMERNLLGANNRYIRAVSVDSSTDGSPGCRTPMTYVFGPINSTILPLPFTLALPYGTWTLTSGASAATATQPVDDKRVSIAVTGSKKMVAGTTVVVLDPRTVATDGRGAVVPVPAGSDDDDDDDEDD
jgi:hypothetical protein